MLRDMFADVREPSITVGSKKRYTVTMSVAVHTAIVIAVMIIPLVATDALLPTPPMTTVFMSMPVRTPPPPPPPQTGARSPRADEGRAPRAPIQPPTGITPETHRDPLTAAPPDSIDGVFAGVVDGILSGRGEIVAPPPAPVPTVSEPVHVGKVKPPAKIRDVKPIYPAIAQSARVQGVVIVEATIGPDGTVQSAKVLRSIPLLDQAAIEAVG